MSFQEAMDRYGSDKPDTRFDVFLQDFTDIFKNAEAGVFRELAGIGNTVRGLVAPKTAYSRKQLDDIALYVKQLGGAGVGWIKIGDDGINAAPIVKNAGTSAVDAVIQKSGAQKETLVFLMAGPTEATLNLLGTLRLELAVERIGFRKAAEHALGSRFPAPGVRFRGKPVGLPPSPVHVSC
jgi:aspartyl-tRNA synthetase